MKRERQHGFFAEFDSTKVDERGVVGERVEYLGTAGGEVVNEVQMEDEELAGVHVEGGHAVDLVEAGHAVDPGVHVAAVEVGEAEEFGEEGVECRPVGDAAGVDFEDGVFHGLGTLERTV